MTRDLLVQFLAQGAQMTLVVLIAPLAAGVVRRVKARLMRRQGPPLLQAYLDLAPKTAADDEERREHARIVEHVKTLRRRVATFN